MDVVFWSGLSVSDKSVLLAQTSFCTLLPTLHMVPQEASKAQTPQWVLIPWSYLGSGRTLFSKQENPSTELFH